VNSVHKEAPLLKKTTQEEGRKGRRRGEPCLEEVYSISIRNSCGQFNTIAGLI
jgi:hypothetical protein